MQGQTLQVGKKNKHDTNLTNDSAFSQFTHCFPCPVSFYGSNSVHVQAVNSARWLAESQKKFLCCLLQIEKLLIVI